ncbi:MAG TPA: hypothetical protein VLF71_03965 [Candidatus Saccharimonadales bacterium]|nr:hypothetical protein [Candidatus Saccharimonadales bacterium]
MALFTGRTSTLDIAFFSTPDPDDPAHPTFQAITAPRGADGGLATHWGTPDTENATWNAGGLTVRFGSRGEMDVILPVGHYSSGEPLPAMVNSEFVIPVGIPEVPVARRPSTEQALGELLLSQGRPLQPTPV